MNFTIAATVAHRLVKLPTYVAAPHEFHINGLVLPKDKMVAVSSHAYLPYEFALNQKGTAIFSGQAELDAMFDRLNRKFIFDRKTNTFTQADILAAIMCAAK